MLLDALLLALYVMLASVATAAPLTSEVCATYDQNTLWPSANLAALAADQVLEKSGNYAAFDAVVVTIVDADAGAANGGATNPDGSYSAVYFNASSGAIPPGLCDVREYENHVILCNNTDLLLPCSITALALHNTIILISINQF